MSLKRTRSHKQSVLEKLPLEWDDKEPTDFNVKISGTLYDEYKPIISNTTGVALYGTLVRHCANRGHTDEIAAVTISPDSTCIVSCSVDCTTRVWKAPTKEERAVADACRSYLLHAVALHSHAVMDVALGGNNGPVFSGLANGEVSIFSLHTQPSECFKRQRILTVDEDGGVVNNVYTHRDSEDTLLLALSLDAQTSHMVTISTVCDDPREEGYFLVDRVCEMPHEGLVLAVRFVPRQDGSQEIRLLATLAKDAITIWDLSGSKMLQVTNEALGIREMWTMDISHDGLMLCAGGSDKVCVLELRYEGDKPQLDQVATYETPEVDTLVFGPFGHLIIDVRADLVVSCWNVKAEEDQKRYGENGLASHLVAAEVDTTLATAQHPHIVHIAVAVGSEDHPLMQDGIGMVCGCRGGEVRMFDMSGDDAGECIAQLRSLSYYEFYQPFIVLAIDFLQTAAFAFAKDIPWHWRVGEPAGHAASAMILDVHSIDLHVHGFSLKLDTGMSHMVKLVTVTCVLVLFAFLAISGSYTRLSKAEEHLRTRIAKKEVDEKHELGGCDIMIVQRHCLKILERVVSKFLDWCTTPLMVPIAKTCADNVLCTVQHSFASTAEEHCFVSGSYRSLELISCTLFFVYLVLLPAYAAVEGDSKYVRADHLLDFNRIYRSSLRHTNCVYKGSSHVRNSFQSKMMWCSKKLLVCVAAVCMRFQARLIAMSIVSGLSFLVSLKVRTRHHPWWQVLERGVSFLLVCIFLCSLWTAILEDPANPAPACALLSSCVAVITVTLALAVYVWHPDQEGQARYERMQS